MKSPFLITLLCFCLTLTADAQEWRHFAAADCVNSFILHKGKLWVTSPVGLTRIDVNTGEQTTWSLTNSDLPDYHFDELAIDSSGILWMGGSYETNYIVRFDGQTFETIHTILSDTIELVHDMLVTPDGKVWLYGHFNGNSLVYYENDQFVAVDAPAGYRHFPGTYSHIGSRSESHVFSLLRDLDNTQTSLAEYDGSQWIIHDLSALGVNVSPGDAWATDSEDNVYMLVSSLDYPQLIKYDGVAWTPVDFTADVNDYLNQRRPIYIDVQDRIWISLDNNTFMRFDGQSWTTIDVSDMGLTNGYPDGILLDDHDKMWFIYSNQDIYGRANTLYSFDGISTKIDLSNSTIPTNLVGQALIDPQNNKWFGSGSHLLKFDGNSWIDIPLQEYAYPMASNHNGGVWLHPFESELRQFDGVTTTQIDVTDPTGIPYQSIYSYTADDHGKLYVPTGGQEVLVFDHGDITYLPRMPHLLWGTTLIDDLSEHLALDTAGNVYSMGYGLHKFQNGEWINVPLWTDSPDFIGRFFIAPNNNIWVSHGLPLPNREQKFKVYNGTDWIDFSSPLFQLSCPVWDADGNLWMHMREGLCKFANNEWTCYNETNSPLPAARIGSFVFDDHNNAWISLVEGGVMLFNDDQINNIEGQNLPIVGGSIYRDLNQNDILDAGDMEMPLQRAMLLPDSTITFSLYDGKYHFASEPGQHQVNYLPRPNWHIDNALDSYAVEVNQASIGGLDFIIAPDEEQVAMNIFMHEGFPRCNREGTYWLTYNNFGTRIEDGEILFIPDPKSTVVETDPPYTAVSGDTLIWSVTDLSPFQTEQIGIVVKMPGPPDSTLLFKSFFRRIYNNIVTLEDSVISFQYLLCSYDPNDKIARTIRSNNIGQSLLEDELFYTIRFQNTGNDTAFTIVIRDTLDADLDIASLEITGAIHPYTASVKPGGVLEFRFDDILLPDSTINELRSHGFISYSIKVKSTLTTSTIIENTAHIYFDFNPGIQTNITANELVPFFTGTNTLTQSNIRIQAFPNPASDAIMVEILDPEIISFAYELVDLKGNVLGKGTIHAGEATRISIAGLPKGMYAIQATAKGKQGSIVFVKGE